MSKDWPPLLRLLGEELGYRVRPGAPTRGYELFYVDLSSWKLRLSDRTPVVWVKSADLEAIASPKHLTESWQDIIRERGLRHETLLVLLDGDRTPFLPYAASPLYHFAVIGADEQKTILHSRRPSAELLDLVSAQVPISNLAPYETSSPVTGSRFFGREYETTKILANLDTNHVILGVRRIGKTSLLQEIQRKLNDEENPPPVVYLDLSDLTSLEDYVREVVRKLHPQELPRLSHQKYVFFFPNFLERMRQKYKSKIIFLLDEVDNLIKMEQGEWELLKLLRASANKGACQYIFAGFWETMREQYNQDSPFYNLARPTRLTEFSRQQAYDLIVRPLENLRVRFHDKEGVVGRIYEETAGHPNLIQYYCTVLVRQLDQTNTREISPDSLINVYTDENFRDHLLQSFMYNTQNREKAIVYALLKRDTRLNSFTQPHIDATLRRAGVALPQGDIDEGCNLLVLAGIFNRRGKEFSFTSSVFATVLRQNYDLDYLLNKAKEEGL